MRRQGQAGKPGVNRDIHDRDLPREKTGIVYFANPTMKTKGKLNPYRSLGDWGTQRDSLGRAQRASAAGQPELTPVEISVLGHTAPSRHQFHAPAVPFRAITRPCRSTLAAKMFARARRGVTFPQKGRLRAPTAPRLVPSGPGRRKKQGTTGQKFRFRQTAPSPSCGFVVPPSN